LTEDIISGIVGEYLPPIDGITFTVSLKEGKIYLAQTGGTFEEIKPDKTSEDLVSFKMKRNRIDFVLENGAAKKLIFTEPFMTFEAPRKA